MIILCGCDKVGKTSLARELLDRLPGWSYRHHTNPAKIAPCYNYLLWFLADTHSRVIVDRLHWSDWAYGHTYRGGPELTPSQRRIVELCCLALETKVCLMTDSAEGIRSRWNEREMFDASGIDSLLKCYGELEQQVYCLGQPVTALPSVTLNYSTKGRAEFDDVVAALVQREQEIKRRNLFGLPCSAAIGSPLAEFLVIGESLPKAPPPLGDHGSAPDVPFARGYAAEWWWRAADAVGLRWWEGAYTNATALGPDYLRGQELQKQLQLRYRNVSRILCLGEEAWKVVEQARQLAPTACAFKSYRVAHPRYVRQFHHRDFPYWASLIGEHLRPYCANPAPTQADAWGSDDYDALMEDED